MANQCGVDKSQLSFMNAEDWNVSTAQVISATTPTTPPRPCPFR